MVFKNRDSVGLKILFTWTQLSYIMTAEVNEKIPGLNYILLWTPYPKDKSLTCCQYKLIMKPKEFTVMDCKFKNCYLTNNGHYFPDTSYFDAILFDSVFTHYNVKDLPEVRSDDQIYIFVSRESSYSYPIRHKNDKYNGFFNYTWTYKLNSDIPFPYIVVRNRSNGEIIAPSLYTKWADTNQLKLSLVEEVKRKLRNKNIAAAWFVSNCDTPNRRKIYAQELKEVLNNYDLRLDIYGDCGPLKCPKEEWEDCEAKIASDYFFYLSFENSNSEDFVTEQLLHAVNNYAIPVVLGGANYTRFMPQGTFFDARVFDPETMGKKIKEMIGNLDEYYRYLKWNRYYSYHDPADSADSNPHCALCAFLNGDWRGRRQTYEEFTSWWNADSQGLGRNTKVHFDLPKKRYFTRAYKKEEKEAEVTVTSNPFYEFFFDILKKLKLYSRK